MRRFAAAAHHAGRPVRIGRPGAGGLGADHLDGRPRLLLAERQAAEEPAPAKAALANLGLKAPGSSFADQAGVPGLGESLFLEDAAQGVCGVRMHAHTTPGRAVIFPAPDRSGYDE